MSTSGDYFDRQIEHYRKVTIKRVCLFFGLEEYDDFAARLKRVRQTHRLPDNTRAVTFLLDHYENHRS